MSKYAVSAAGPTIAFQNGNYQSVVVENTGSYICYLSETPGIATFGRMLRPGATYEWPEATPLYIQCTPGSEETTTVLVGENSGTLFTPAVLNTPGQLFQNNGAVCASGIPPVDGQGDQWVNAGGSLTRYSVTPIMDCTNYNSIVLTAKELGNGGPNRVTREVVAVWYQTLKDGSTVITERETMRYLVQNLSDPSIIGSDIQLMALLPTKGTSVQIYIDGPTWALGGINALYFGCYGDNRVLDRPKIKILSWGTWDSDNVAFPFSEIDLSTASCYEGFGNLPVGTWPYHFSSQSGPNKFFVRFNTGAAALSRNTRVEILDSETTRPIAATNFDSVAAGIHVWNDIVYLPFAPVRLNIVNAQAVDLSTFVSVVPIES